MTAIKICGITDVANGVVAIDAGADYLGFVFYPPSSRALTPEAASELIDALRTQRPGAWQAVGVFVNEPLEFVRAVRERCTLDVVQLNGEETPAYVQALGGPVFKSARYQAGVSAPRREEYQAERILLDANVPGEYGGTGLTYDWSQVGEAVADGFLAGGLTPDNVEDALRAAKPWGVDVSSGVERNRTKDPTLIRAFISAVRAVDRELGQRAPTASMGGTR